MNTQKVTDELRRKYSGKSIIINEPEEILCEIEPTEKHPEKSLAMVVVGRSKPHFHKVTTETYEVISGELTVKVDGKKYILKKGEKLTLKPGQVHSAVGNETWFLTSSIPGWTPADHFLS
jgi:quercetin dioxygenase-like cupin family protein